MLLLSIALQVPMWCLLWPSDPCQLSAYGVAKPNSGYFVCWTSVHACRVWLCAHNAPFFFFFFFLADVCRITQGEAEEGDSIVAWWWCCLWECFEENSRQFCSSMVMLCSVYGFVGSEMCRCRLQQQCWNFSSQGENSKRLLDPEKNETKWSGAVWQQHWWSRWWSFARATVLQLHRSKHGRASSHIWCSYSTSRHGILGWGYGPHQEDCSSFNSCTKFFNIRTAAAFYSICSATPNIHF